MPVAYNNGILEFSGIVTTAELKAITDPAALTVTDGIYKAQCDWSFLGGCDTSALNDLRIDFNQRFIRAQAAPAIFLMLGMQFSFFRSGANTGRDRETIKRDADISPDNIAYPDWRNCVLTNTGTTQCRVTGADFSGCIITSISGAYGVEILLKGMGKRILNSSVRNFRAVTFNSESAASRTNIAMLVNWNVYTNAASEGYIAAQQQCSVALVNWAPTYGPNGGSYVLQSWSHQSGRGIFLLGDAPDIFDRADTLQSYTLPNGVYQRAYSHYYHYRSGTFLRRGTLKYFKIVNGGGAKLFYTDSAQSAPQELLIDLENISLLKSDTIINIPSDEEDYELLVTAWTIIAPGDNSPKVYRTNQKIEVRGFSKIAFIFDGSGAAAIERVEYESYVPTLIQDDPAIQVTEAAAAAITGIAINEGAQTVTVSGDVTVRDIYHYAKYWYCLDSNLHIETMPFTATEAGGILRLETDYDMTISGNLSAEVAGESITSSGTITLTGSSSASLTDLTGTRISITINGIVIGYEVVIGEKTGSGGDRVLYDIDRYHAEAATESTVNYSFVTDGSEKTFVVQVIPGGDDAKTVKPFRRTETITDQSKTIDVIYEEFQS